MMKLKTAMNRMRYAIQEPLLAGSPKEVQILGYHTKTGQEGCRSRRRHLWVCRICVRRNSIKGRRENGSICQEPSTINTKHDDGEGVAQDKFANSDQECDNAAKEVEGATEGLTMSVRNFKFSWRCNLH
jgi:hypothetical protein